MVEPIISGEASGSGDAAARFSAVGKSFIVHEWRGSGPAVLHVHHADDEAWHVLEGTLRFRFSDRQAEVGPGGTVFVPAGVAHTYEAVNARYLIILTPRLASLIAELQQTKDRAAQPGVYRKDGAELPEPEPHHARRGQSYVAASTVRVGARAGRVLRGRAGGISRGSETP